MTYLEGVDDTYARCPGTCRGLRTSELVGGQSNHFFVDHLAIFALHTHHESVPLYRNNS